MAEALTQGGVVQSESAILTCLLDHNRWATSVLLRDCVRLSPDQWRRRFEIGLGSLQHTLRHVVGAMLRWADRIAEREILPSIESNGQDYAPQELEELLARGDAALRSVAAELVATGRLGEPMGFPHEGGVYRFSKLSAFVHVATHGVHHRAQALNMRRQLGLPPLGLDLDAIESELVRDGQIAEA